MSRKIATGVRIAVSTNPCPFWLNRDKITIMKIGNPVKIDGTIVVKGRPGYYWIRLENSSYPIQVFNRSIANLGIEHRVLIQEIDGRLEITKNLGPVLPGQ